MKNGSTDDRPMTREADDHLRLAPCRSAHQPTDGLEDELGDGPAGDDDAEHGGIDALVLDEQRKDWQKRAEAEHDDELGLRTGSNGPQRRAMRIRARPWRGGLDERVGHRSAGRERDRVCQTR